MPRTTMLLTLGIYNDLCEIAVQYSVVLAIFVQYFSVVSDARKQSALISYLQGDHAKIYEYCLPILVVCLLASSTEYWGRTRVK